MKSANKIRFPKKILNPRNLFMKFANLFCFSFKMQTKRTCSQFKAKQKYISDIKQGAIGIYKNKNDHKMSMIQSQ